VPIAVEEPAESRFPEPKLDKRLPETAAYESPIAFGMPCKHAEIDPISVTSLPDEDLGQVVPETLSVTASQPKEPPRKRRNPWSGYDRPEPAPQREGTPVFERVGDAPLPSRAAEERQTPVRKTVGVPAYVLDAKIAEQGGRCIYCAREFGSPVLHDSEVVILRPQVEHFRPRSGGGRTSDANITVACHICNVLKSDFLFYTVDDCRQFLVGEWVRRLYRNCPPLIPFQRAPAFVTSN
jgi:5-methylcytosine-specific restriction endonuclease McrA